MKCRPAIQGCAHLEVCPEQLRISATAAEPNLRDECDELGNPALKLRKQMGRIGGQPTGQDDDPNVEDHAEIGDDQRPAFDRAVDDRPEGGIRERLGREDPAW